MTAGGSKEAHLSKAPKAPDAAATSQAQGVANRETAAFQQAMNNVNQTTPFGSLTYSQTGKDPTTGAPIWSANTSLSPELKSLLDKQMASQGNIADVLNTTTGFLPTSAFDPSGIPDTGEIARKSFALQTDLLKPQWDDQWKKMEVNLSDRGIPVGSEIWNDQKGQFDDAVNRSMTAASGQADLTALGEQQRLIQNAERQYGMPYDQIAKLMGTNPAVTNPAFQQTGQTGVANTDVAGNIWNAYQAKAAQSAGTNQALAGLGSAAIMLSDERLKENRVPADGEAILGKIREMPVDDYDYKPEARKVMNLPESRTGPMAGDYARLFKGDGSTIDLGDAVGNIFASIKALEQRTRELAA
jgi:hypothetical protein